MIGNLLVVDDEPDILEGLVELFEIELEEITVYSAKNARISLELLSSIHFDVVVTDINMPKMNGIEMFKEIHKNWPQCRVIFLTGYREFDHLYEVSRYPGVAYMLKSESDYVLVALVKQAFEEVEAVLQETAYSEGRGTFDSPQYKYLKLKLSQYLETSKPLSADFIQNFSVKIDFDPNVPFFFFFVHLDRDSPVTLVDQDDAVASIVNDFTPEGFSTHYQRVSECEGLLFFQSKEPLRLELVSKWFSSLSGAVSYIQEKMLKTLNISISFVVSEKLVDFGDVISTYNQTSILRYRYLKRSVQGIFYLDVNRNDQQEPVNNGQLVYHLNQALSEKNRKVFEKIINQVVDVLDLPDPDPNTAELYFGTMSILFTALLQDHSYVEEWHDFFVPFEEKDRAIKKVIKTASYIAERYLKAFEAEGMDTLKNAIDYIESNTGADLSLNNLAKISYLNPSYLSRIFKQVTGKTISTYVSEKRIEKAKELLKNPAMRINEIGVAVGYDSPRSFSRFFKKMTNMSPIEYRDRWLL